MNYVIFARWFGFISLFLSLGVLFNLEDAKEMAKNLVKHETSYILGGVLPIIFGMLPLVFVDSFDFNWNLVVTLIGLAMVFAGVYRVFFVNRWRALIHKHIEDIPFLFSLFGLMFSVLLLYVGYLANTFSG